MKKVTKYKYRVELPRYKEITGYKYTRVKLQEYKDLTERAENLLTKAQELVGNEHRYERAYKGIIVSVFSAILGLLIFGYKITFNPVPFGFPVGQYLLDLLKFALNQPLIVGCIALSVSPITIVPIARRIASVFAKLKAKWLMKKADKCYEEYKHQNEHLIETFRYGAEKILTNCRLYDWTQIAKNSSNQTAKQLRQKMVEFGVNRDNFEEVGEKLFKDVLDSATKGIPKRLEEELEFYLYHYLELPIKNTK